MISIGLPSAAVMLMQPPSSSRRRLGPSDMVSRSIFGTTGSRVAPASAAASSATSWSTPPATATTAPSRVARSTSSETVSRTPVAETIRSDWLGSDRELCDVVPGVHGLERSHRIGLGHGHGEAQCREHLGDALAHGAESGDGGAGSCSNRRLGQRVEQVERSRTRTTGPCRSGCRSTSSFARRSPRSRESRVRLAGRGSATAAIRSSSLRLLRPSCRAPDARSRERAGSRATRRREGRRVVDRAASTARSRCSASVARESANTVEPLRAEGVGDRVVGLVGVRVHDDLGAGVAQQEGEHGGLWFEHHRDADPSRRARSRRG